MYRYLFSLLLLLFSLSLRAQRLTDWQFVRTDMGTAWEVWRPALAGKPESVPLWTAVRVPHCYNADDACDPDRPYYQGQAWYRTTVSVRNPYPGGRTLLRFAGVGQQAEVYVYTTRVATHVGGYDQWEADITAAVDAFRQTDVCQKQFHGRIPIAVRCDNRRDREMIPSDMSDFNLYGGLYRPVTLVYESRLAIAELHVIPTFILPQDNDAPRQGKSGTVRLDLRLHGTPTPSSRLNLIITDPKGKVVARQSTALAITVKSSSPSPNSVAFSSPSPYSVTLPIRRPALWSPSRPALYHCTATLIADGDTSTVTSSFGFRSFALQDHGPFLLNGQRLLLRGTHRHEDHAGVGAALTDSMTRRELQQIKDMGANFIRLGHYQQSDLVLDLCDSLGLLVWEEIPWCRGGLGGERYQQQALSMLRSMIRHHYNHPSVIFWGMGNENDWPGDFEPFDKDSIRWFMQTLVDESHRLDPSRLTVCRRCDFASDIVDAYSPTIWAGWYSGHYTDYYRMERQAWERTPRFIHAEWGADSHVGRYEEKSDSAFAAIDAGDRHGDWSESYAVRLFDWHLHEQQRMPWLSGTAFWTFKDFSTPLRPRNPIPYVNQKGVVERDGTPKESYYVFQSYWSTKPMVHILGHSCPVRWDEETKNESTGKAQRAESATFTSPGQSEAAPWVTKSSDEPRPERAASCPTKEVLVYSNCPWVELFANGVSQGIRHRDPQAFPACGLRWDVVYSDTATHLLAVGYKDKPRGSRVSKQKGNAPIYNKVGSRQRQAVAVDSLVQHYQRGTWGAPDHLTLTQQGDLLTATLRDADGRICLDARQFVRFSTNVDTALPRNEGTSTGSRLIQLSNGQARIRLLPHPSGTVVTVLLEDGLSIPLCNLTVE